MAPAVKQYVKNKDKEPFLYYTRFIYEILYLILCHAYLVFPWLAPFWIHNPLFSR